MKTEANRAVRVAVSAWLLVAACDAYDHDLGPTPFLCGPAEPRCPEGYRCVTDPAVGEPVCVSESAPPGVTCIDDGASEPNDMLVEASPASLDASGRFSVDGAVCPEVDRDLFVIELDRDGLRIEIGIEADSGGGALRGSILNAGAIPIATTEPDPTTPGRGRAVTSALPRGMYYVEAASARIGIVRINNYALDVAVGP